MKEIVKIQKNEKGEQVVSARELHEYLELGTEFRHWIVRMLDYGFEENKDWSKLTVDNEAFSYDYVLTLDTAKQIAMLQRTDKGKEARLYFIECEKKLKESSKTLTQAEFLLQQAQMMVEQERRINQVETRMELLESKLEDHIQFMTIMGYCSNNGIKVNLLDAANYGRKASLICKENGIKTGTIPDPRFGRVKTYPIDILHTIFKN